MGSVRFLEKDVPECYYLISMLMGSIDFYMLYETWAGEPGEDSIRSRRLEELPFGREIVDELSELAETIFIDGLKNENIADTGSRVFAFRDRVKDLALGLIAYSDRFRLYEYVLNRTKPVDRSTLKTFNNDAEARDVLSAIFSSGENAQINENIKLAVSQLPLRMSKSKFYDIMDNSFRKFVGADSLTLDRQQYLIRTSAGLVSVPEDDFPELREALEFFKNADMEDIDSEGYMKLEERMVDAVGLITDMSELLQSVETVANRMAVMILCHSGVETDFSKDLENVKILAGEAIEGIKRDSVEDMSDRVLKTLRDLEGRFEPVTEKLMSYQNRAAKLDKNEDLDALQPLLGTFDSCEKLMSPSVFADLKDPETHALTAEELDRAAAELKSELNAAFAEDSRIMQRSRMSAVLAQLPVFFDSRTDVMNYVRDSLDGCRDTYEKMVSVRLILDTINADR